MESSQVSVRTIPEIFSKRSACEAYLRIERELAPVQAEIGVVPDAAARAIGQCARIEFMELDELDAQNQHTGYPIAPLVRQIVGACGEHGRYVHWGATTQDILNTALAMQANEAFNLLAQDLRAIIARLAALTNEHRDTLMVARTFGGHALPITFGFKVAVWLSAGLRHAERLEVFRRNPLEGEFAGAAGSLASLQGFGLQVRRRLMARLGLPEPLITWGAMRDRVVERVMFLAALSGTLAKIGQDIAELASTEIGELAEPISGGKDASSTLPYKSNPVYCAQAAVAASRAAQYASTVLQSMRQHQERSAEGLLEFETVPQVFLETHRCVDRVRMVLDGLRVYPGRMATNLGLTRGIILAERYMMALAPYMGRLAAHDLLHEACKTAIERGMELSEVLGQTAEVTQFLDIETLAYLGNPRTYLGDAPEMLDQVLAAAGRFLEERRS